MPGFVSYVVPVRARAWTIAQTMAWCFDSPLRSSNLETVRWLLDAA
jgi:hypothetical protein